MDIQSDSGQDQDSVQIRFESATPPRLLFDDEISCPGSPSPSPPDLDSCSNPSGINDSAMVII